MIHAIWQYAHNHWQDNVLASAIWAIPAYLWGRYHLKRIHLHLSKQDDHVKAIHEHLGIHVKGVQDG